VFPAIREKERAQPVMPRQELRGNGGSRFASEETSRPLPKRTTSSYPFGKGRCNHLEEVLSLGEGEGKFLGLV